MDKKKLSVQEMVLFGVLGALTFALKLAMAALPNIEPVSLMVMLCVVVFGLRGLWPVYIYVVMEILVYGINLWNINYLYVWAILGLLAWVFRGMQSGLGWAILSGAFGLLFGALCAPVYLFIGGPGYALSWWASGMLFDVYHCVGNFIITLVLFVPLRTRLTLLYKTMSPKR